MVDRPCSDGPISRLGPQPRRTRPAFRRDRIENWSSFLIWSHFLRRTDSHFAGKCFSESSISRGRRFSATSPTGPMSSYLRALAVAHNRSLRAFWATLLEKIAEIGVICPRRDCLQALPWDKFADAEAYSPQSSPRRIQQKGFQMLKFVIGTSAALAMVGAAAAADMPRPQPAPPTPVVGKAPIGKTPIGKTPIGKTPVVATKG
jgi:hypothetical protein